MLCDHFGKQFPPGVSIEPKTRQPRVFVSATIDGVRHRRSKLLMADASAEDARKQIDLLKAELSDALGPAVEVSPLAGDLGPSLMRRRRLLRSWPNEIERAVGDPQSWFARILPAAEKRARKKRLTFELSVDDFKTICLRSNGCCEVTGLPFSLGVYRAARMKPFAPSLDRIDATLGYTSANCRLVCAAVNVAMFNWGEELFRSVAVGYVSNLLRRWQPSAERSLPRTDV